MNNAAASTVSCRHWTWLSPLALLLSLTACGPDEDARTMRVKYGEDWKEFELEAARRNDFVAGGPHRLYLCGTGGPIPGDTEDETSLCIGFLFAPPTFGSGPATFAIDGTATLSARQLPHSEAFTPGPAHSEDLLSLQVDTSCRDFDSEVDAVHQVSGRLELEENSFEKLAGHLLLRTQGTPGGVCVGSAVEANLRFDLDMFTDVRPSP